MSLAFLLFLIAAIVCGICVVIPEAYRTRLLVGALGLVALGLAVGAYHA